MIMNVACFFSQHSPMLGQPASSHTVTRLWSRTSLRVSWYFRETGALTRSQSGFFRCTGLSGLCAFSGCRGLAGWSLVTVSRTVVKSAALDGPVCKDQHAGTKYRHDKLPHDAAQPDAEQAKQEVADHSADNPSTMFMMRPVSNFITFSAIHPARPPRMIVMIQPNPSIMPSCQACRPFPVL
jgi:hypothetical protein